MFFRCLLFLSLLGTCVPRLLGQSTVPDIAARINQYDPDHFNAVVRKAPLPLDAAGNGTLTVGSSTWSARLSQSPLTTPAGPATAYTLRFVCTAGALPAASVSVDLTFPQWSEDNYVLLPAAAYNGNRFAYRRIRYSPKLLDPRDIGPDVPTIVSDVPKLTLGPGPSRMQQRTGDMSTPAVGFRDATTQRAFLLFSDLGTRLGDSGVDVSENRDRSQATVSITAPVVRELYQYRITDSRHPSADRPHDFTTGDTVTLRFHVHEFAAPRLQDLFDRFATARHSLLPRGEPNLVLPFSSAFTVQEKKFNRLNWEPTFGYYSVGPRNMFLQDWQIGWTGGMISTFPLLWLGGDTTRQNVLRNFDWLFPDGIAPSGLFWDSGEGGDRWYGGDIRKPHTVNWHLIRKSGDGLYYLIKQLMLLEKMGLPVKHAWREGTREAANALVRIWREAGQFGQFVDNRTGEVLVGGSTSGGSVPAALVLAADYFANPAYHEVAAEAATAYLENYVQKGLTNGGPGDAMQNPDSESCYALLESFALLYEHTGEDRWLAAATDLGRQFSTWVISYDYPFPPTSLFGREGMRSTGAVFANTQNKHGAPGICTHSGVALLRLYRATGDPFFAHLLQDIARNMPQYLPHPRKPIAGCREGWMCERVSTTDWLEGIGEISYLTTWSETALMLTYAEIPGLYVEPDRQRVTAFDNVTARFLADQKDSVHLQVSNPTKMDATVKVLCEDAGAKQAPLGELALWRAQTVFVPAGQTVVAVIKK